MSVHVQLQRLSPTGLETLKNHFKNSPTTTKLITYFLQIRKETVNTSEAVKYIYGTKADGAGYRTCENRFYKLRRKLQDYLQMHVGPDQSILTTEENNLLHAKSLIIKSQYKEALKLLEATEKSCREKNLFEFWPEVLDTLIATRQSLNMLDENPDLHKRFTESLLLFTDLMEAKNTTRRIYEVNFKEGTIAAEPLFKKLSALARKHPDRPRFKLIYNFVAGYYKTGSGDANIRPKTNVTNRHIGVAKRIMLQYPGMPVIQHTAIGQLLQRYRLMELQAMAYYNALRFQEAVMEITTLYDIVTKKDSAMNRLKNEILYTNTLRILVGAGKFIEALKVVKAYIRFLLENDLHQQTAYAYAEVANIHTAMFPQPSGYDTAFLHQQIDEYLQRQSPESAASVNRQLLPLKVKLLITDAKFTDALNVFRSISNQKPSELSDIEMSIPSLLKLLSLPNTAERTIGLQQFKEQCYRNRLNARTPADFLHWRWLERVSGHYTDMDANGIQIIEGR